MFDFYWPSDIDEILLGRANNGTIESAVMVCPKVTRANGGDRGFLSYGMNRHMAEVYLSACDKPSEVLEFGDSDDSGSNDSSINQDSISRYPVYRHFNELHRNFSFVDGHALMVPWASIINQNQSPYLRWN